MKLDLGAPVELSGSLQHDFRLRSWDDLTGSLGASIKGVAMNDILEGMRRRDSYMTILQGSLLARFAIRGRL